MGGVVGGSSVPAMALSYFGFRNNKQEEGGVQQETESMKKRREEEEEEEGKARKSSEASGRAARFAVELDGLHCFETLIAH
ncbi:unnamed protein product [Musa acuminata subsp. malaccensis]|uniref:(wild Malaysian banana) hypothetical protein n=1 Tax=Musa acuminata subsp. malaccensis TaxID=214687 RepID=A0A804L2R4_MUSAM|nr:unnamed protein product [Musa acuminata subsp. malaccensis]